MTATYDAVWMAGPRPWCAVCLTSRVQFPSLYECAVCDPTPPRPLPSARLPLDRPISTSGGEL